MHFYPHSDKTIRSRRALILLLPLLLCGTAGAALGATDDFLRKASGTYIIPSQAIIATFSVGQLPFGGITGRFHTISGKFILNGKNIKRSSVSLTIKPKSLKTENPETDAYLRGKDFFHVAKFPKATFKSTSIKRTGDKTAKLTGLLKIKETSLPISFDVVFQSAQREAAANNRFVLKFSAKGAFKRSKYGMTAGIPIFSDAVKLDIQVTGTRK